MRFVQVFGSAADVGPLGADELVCTPDAPFKREDHARKRGALAVYHSGALLRNDGHWACRCCGTSADDLRDTRITPTPKRKRSR